LTEIDSENTGVAEEPERQGWLADLGRLDLAVYAAIARTPTPSLDRAMARLSQAADHSKLSLASAGTMSVFGGRTGRRAAIRGLVSVAATAAIVNGPMKLSVRRPRPDRLAGDVPIARHVPMPVTRSFPSGHSAAAFAFATGVGQVSAPLALPLRALAAAVSYSRVHTGVHYPGDALIGALVGASIAEAVGRTGLRAGG
jgi:membrane-associated phospholipid phosphatase